MTGDQYNESHIGLAQGLAGTMEPGVADMELLASISERMKVPRAPLESLMDAEASPGPTVGVEKRPLPANAIKVPTSPMMRSRPVVRTEAKLAPARLARVTVAGLRVAGPIASATFGLCCRASLKMAMGGGNGLEVFESVSVSLSFVQSSAACLRWCRPFW